MNPCPKNKTHRDKKYLLWLRDQECVFCGATKIEGHVDIVPTHNGGGIGLKGPDDHALPLCAEHHSWEHNGPLTFWALVDVKTGKSRQQLVDEHWARYIKK